MAPPFIRANVRDMSGYTPGEQPAPGDRVVKLNTNENPFPPSDRVMKVFADVEPEMLRRYPDPTADIFRDAAAKLHSVSRDMILAGNGSDDILTIATRACVGPSCRLAMPDPTYSLYPVLAALQQATAVPVSWGPRWSLPVEALLATNADAIYLANPNAPSGTFVEPEAVAGLASRFPGLLLIDEAYADFADRNCLALVREHDNVIVSRTMSKAYSLAGVRFGYAVAQQSIIAQMMKVKDVYNCDAISILAATAAIEDQATARQTWQYVRSERGRLADALAAMGWSALPSHANFLLVTCPGGSGQKVYQKLKQQGILVRYFDLPGLTDRVRITVGQSHENNALLAGIKRLAADEKTA